MHIFDTETKKFASPQSVDLGKLPVFATFDFVVTSGGKPAVLSGKFRLEIGDTVKSEKYAYCDDKLSFRRVEMTAASATMPVKVYRDNVEILSDSMSFTFTQGGGGGSIIVDTVLDASSENPIANKAVYAAVGNVEESLAELI